MRGIVFYKNRDAGLEQFYNIKENYEYFLRIKCVNIQLRQDGSASMSFENGDQWILLGTDFCCRGRRANVAYIERSISEEVLKALIAPMITAYPYQAIHLYGDGNLCIQSCKEDK